MQEPFLVDRRVYLLSSRNLRLGVWVAAERGFIGLRRKFDNVYPFTEYSRDVGPPYGTATALADLGVNLPASIEAIEGRAICKACEQPAEFDQDARTWSHIEDSECEQPEWAWARTKGLDAFLREQEEAFLR